MSRRSQREVWARLGVEGAAGSPVSVVWLPDTTERNAGMLRVPLVASHGRTGYWLVLRVALSWSPSASAGLSQLLDHDLDDGPGAAILGGPPLLESAHDHDSAAPLGLAGVLSLVAPDDHGEERRLLLPPTADGHPEHGSGDATLGVADLGVVGEVAGEAHGWLGHGVPLSVVWPGGLLCPWNRGRRTPWHAERAPGASGGANEVGNGSRLPSGLGSGAGLVGGALVPGGRACQHRPARSLHPGRGGRTRLPPRGPLAGPFQAARGASC